jgi:hypothetical protein
MISLPDSAGSAPAPGGFHLGWHSSEYLLSYFKVYPNSVFLRWLRCGKEKIPAFTGIFFGGEGGI